jgi:hypothetical protein
MVKMSLIIGVGECGSIVGHDVVLRIFDILMSKPFIKVKYI